MNLTHHFLISMPQMQDPSFEYTLTYICDHDEQGALGLVINRPLPVSFQEVIEQTGLDSHGGLTGIPVFEGGPVDPGHGLVLHTDSGRDWSATHHFTPPVCISSSRDVLADIAAGHGPDAYLIALGHAGWAPGQLEDEVAANAWLTCPADLTILFATPAQDKLDAAMKTLGISFADLSTDSGHA
ncbi:YqgE/AlgH family protein [Granulosicoccaceae sp. 1_MG-2023]|nr:YqgE/AlgH family protein [Granulosicoccaceae sp. 1_MG-2023]